MDNEIYKSFTYYPFAVCDENGEILDLEQELSLLAEDVHIITDLTNQNLNEKLLEQFQYADDKLKKKKSNYLGRVFRITLPPDVKKGEKGRSRFEELFRTYLFDQLKSWDSRRNTFNGNTAEYTSQGYKRTVNPNKPEYLEPKMSLSSVDSQYVSIQEEENTLVLKLIVKGQWRYFLFNFNNERFYGKKKISKPDITLDKHGYPIFHFTAVYEYIYTDFSTDYIITVDLGLTNYVTASVMRVSDASIVDNTTTTLSADVHSLANKVRKTNKQVASLKNNLRMEEAVPHREGNSRRKRELAILAAREIAELSAQWGNAIVVFEDLSWIENTMQNGRWNRGELVKWTEHFVNLNGGRIAKVNSAYTSQDCHVCDNKVKIVNHHDVYCYHCNEWFDRDYNATGNIGKRFINKGTHAKFVNTRKKSKRVTKHQVIRVTTKKVKNHSPVKVRDKIGPTPRQPKRLKQVKKVNKNGLEVKAVKIGSSNTTGVEGDAKKLVNIMTVTSNQNRRFTRTRSYNHDNLYNLS